MKNKNYSDYPMDREKLTSASEGPIVVDLKTLADKYDLIKPEEAGGCDSTEYINKAGSTTTLQLFYDGTIDAHFYSKDGTYLGAVVYAEDGDSKLEAPQGVFMQSDESDELRFKVNDSMVYVHELMPNQIEKIVGMLNPSED